jgi:hypothetical protein
MKTAKKPTISQKRRQRMLKLVDEANQQSLLPKKSAIDLDKAFGRQSDRAMDVDFDESKSRDVSGIVDIPFELLKLPSAVDSKDELSLAKFLVGCYSENLKFEYVDEFKFHGCQDCLGLFCSNCTSADVLGCDKGKIYIKNGQSMENLIWTIAHELGHYAAHRESHFYNTELGGYLSEGFAETFAMLALPNHERTARFKREKLLCFLLISHMLIWCTILMV